MHFIHFCPTDLNSCPTTVHDQPCYRVSWRWRLPFLSSLNIFFETGRAEGEIDGVRGGKWKFRFRRNSILQSSVFIDFFPQILRIAWFCLYLRLGRKSRKMFIFSDCFPKERNSWRDTVCISFFHSLFFSLLLFDTSPHFVLFSIPPRKFEKSQRPRTGTLSWGWQTSMFRCFGVLSREKFGRPPFWAVSFQPSLENDAVARTAKSSSPSSPLLSPGDVVISVSSWGKFALFKHQPEILGGNNLADSSGSYNDPTPTNYFVSTVEMIPLY